jgi:hypothetical protein
MELDTTKVGNESKAAESSTRTSFLVPSSGRGKELCDMLREALSVPEGCRSFSVRFALNEVVAVTCEYMPKG